MSNDNIPVMESAKKEEPVVPVQEPTQQPEKPLNTEDMRSLHFKKLKEEYSSEFDSIAAGIAMNSTKKNTFNVSEFEKFVPVFQKKDEHEFRNNPDYRKHLLVLTNEYHRTIDPQKPVTITDMSGNILAELPPAIGTIADITICDIKELNERTTPTNQLINYIDKDIKGARLESSYSQLQRQIYEANGLIGKDGKIDIQKVIDIKKEGEARAAVAIARLNPENPLVAGQVLKKPEEASDDDFEITFSND